MSEAAIVTRFAPSPTGRMHLGNARTALFNALMAWGAGGRFLLRIEDTDAARGDDGHVAGLMADLEWMGLEWDGEILRQSRRGDLYGKHYERLEGRDLAYPCFCTHEDLRLARKSQAAAGKPPRYPGTCSRLSSAERREKEERGLPAALRFRVPPGKVAEFADVVRGPQSFASDDLGDFVIRRSDGTPAFLYANALDDALSGITHVLRGEDHVANTPRQLLLLEALELPAPRYGHLPLLVEPEGAPLSKRHGAAALGDLRRAGWLPSAVVNYLARLGHHYESDDQLGLRDLAAGFDPGRLGRSPAHFDPSQLRHWQRLAVAALGSTAFAEWAAEALECVPEPRREAFVQAVSPNCLFPDDARYWAEALFGAPPALSGDAARALGEAGGGFLDSVCAAIDEHGTDLAAMRRASGLEGRAFFMPLRAALTGELTGPELRPVLELMGPERVRERLRQRARELKAEC